MEARAWTNGGGTYGIRVGTRNRNAFFAREWSVMEVEMDGEVHTFKLTGGFWNKCPEFRDSGASHVRDWLRRHKTLDWPPRQPPRAQLVPLGGNRFRLLP